MRPTFTYTPNTFHSLYRNVGPEYIYQFYLHMYAVVMLVSTLTTIVIIAVISFLVCHTTRPLGGIRSIGLY